MAFSTSGVLRDWHAFLRSRLLQHEGKTRSELTRDIGLCFCVTGAVLLVVVTLGVYVGLRAYLSRDYQYGIPSSVAMLATVFCPPAGLLVLAGTGALQQEEI
jgi:hypothetical protein